MNAALSGLVDGLYRFEGWYWIGLRLARMDFGSALGCLWVGLGWFRVGLALAGLGWLRGWVWLTYKLVYGWLRMGFGQV